MSLPPIASPAAWQAAHDNFLVKEKTALKTYDAPSAARRRLPMVEITKPYIFASPDGPASLFSLFDRWSWG